MLPPPDCTGCQGHIFCLRRQQYSGPPFHHSIRRFHFRAKILSTACLPIPLATSLPNHPTLAVPDPSIDVVRPAPCQEPRTHQTNHRAARNAHHTPQSILKRQHDIQQISPCIVGTSCSDPDGTLATIREIRMSTSVSALVLCERSDRRQGGLPIWPGHD